MLTCSKQPVLYPKRNAEAVYEALVKTNEAKKLVRRMPTADQAAEWVKQAKSLARVIEY